MFKIFCSCILFLVVNSCKNNSPSAEKKPVDIIDNKTISRVILDTTSVAEINTSEAFVKLIPHNIHLQKGIDFTLNIPEGYNVSVAAEGLNRLRF